MDILQALYNSEINFSLTTQWDAGFTAKLGDEYNGFGLTEKTFKTLQEAVDYLEELAVKQYPDSNFARGRR